MRGFFRGPAIDWLAGLIIAYIAFAHILTQKPQPQAVRGRAPGELTPSIRRPPVLPDFIVRDNGLSKEYEMGSGTAFALDNQGRWMTARHVVDGCKRVFIAMPPAASGKVRYWLKTDNVKLPLVPARSITEDQRADLAILQTQEVHSEAMAIEGGGAGSDVVGQQGFSIGFPGGEPGQASVKLLGYGMSVMHLGKDWVKSPNMIWAVKELHSSTGEFNGISGGPLLNPLGKVVGVNSSASERRGRLNTVAPESLSLLSGEHVKNPVGGIYSPAGPIDDATYVDTADGLRKRYTIAAVYCVYR